MNQLLTEPAPAKDRRVAPVARGVGVVLACAVMIGVGLWLVREPTFVERVEIRNPTGYDLNVDVTGAGRDGWLPISVATGGGTTTVTNDVVDQDDTWIFRFTYAGRHAGEIRLTRAQLEGNNWRFVVPDQVAERLRANGVLPGP
jgi:hypothetical protein